MKLKFKKIYTTVETVAKSNIKIHVVESIPLTHKSMTAHFPGTDTSIVCGGVKLVLLSQTYLFKTDFIKELCI